MSEKKKILIIQKVHQKGMELIENHPKFEVDVTDDTSEESLKTKIQNYEPYSFAEGCNWDETFQFKIPNNCMSETLNM